MPKSPWLNLEKISIDQTSPIAEKDFKSNPDEYDNVIVILDWWIIQNRHLID